MIGAQWVGRRIVVRRTVGDPATGAGRLADVVGDLVGLDAARAVVETAAGPVEIDLDAVALAKLVPASTADILALEAVAAAGWRPRETETVGGWLLRADAGWSGRANSAVPLRSVGGDTPAQLARVQEWYAERGLPAVVAVPYPARRLLDEYLAQETTWTPGPVNDVRTARLDTLRARTRSEAAPSDLADSPDDGWLAVARDGGIPPAGVAVLTRHDRVVFVSRVVEGRTVASGRGVVDDGWLGITALEVAPAHRRQGHAVALVRDLTRWASDHGATRAYLQVYSDNEPARALYDRLGLAVHHTYRYWTVPS